MFYLSTSSTQNSQHHTNAIFDMFSIWFWPVLLTRANIESYKDLGDKTEGFRRASTLRY